MLFSTLLRYKRQPFLKTKRNVTISLNEWHNWRWATRRLSILFKEKSLFDVLIMSLSPSDNLQDQSLNRMYEARRRIKTMRRTFEVSNPLLKNRSALRRSSRVDVMDLQHNCRPLWALFGPKSRIVTLSSTTPHQFDLLLFSVTQASTLINAFSRH